MTTSGKLIDIIKFTSKANQEEIAAAVGWNPQRLSRKISRDNFTIAEMAEIVGHYGYELALIKTDTGEVPSCRTSGIGRRVKKTVKGVIYDTNNCTALANSFYADGESRYTNGFAEELYMDKENRFFLAVYADNPRVNDNIVVIDPTEAAEFVNKWGSVIDKGPKEYGKYDILPQKGSEEVPEEDTEED